MKVGDRVQSRVIVNNVRLGGAEPKHITYISDEWVGYKVTSSDGEARGEQMTARGRFEEDFEVVPDERARLADADLELRAARDRLDQWAPELEMKRYRKALAEKVRATAAFWTHDMLDGLGATEQGSREVIGNIANRAAVEIERDLRR